MYRLIVPSFMWLRYWIRDKCEVLYAEGHEWVKRSDDWLVLQQVRFDEYSEPGSAHPRCCAFCEGNNHSLQPKPCLERFGLLCIHQT